MKTRRGRGDASDRAGHVAPRPESADDWESHWREYGDLNTHNPAQVLRRHLIVELVERGPRPASVLAPDGPSRILDLGSGQGDLLASLAGRWPDAELAGIDLSAQGVRTAAARVPSARFFQHDLLGSDPSPSELSGWAEVAICSEVLEHLDEPERFLRRTAQLMAPGSRLVVTVPGGPRTAFDRHIGHRRHYRPAALEALLCEAGFDVDVATGTGFPFFDLYKLVVLAQGDRVTRDVERGSTSPRLVVWAMRVFGVLLSPPLSSRRYGWQIVAVAHPAAAPR